LFGSLAVASSLLLKDAPMPRALTEIQLSTLADLFKNFGDTTRVKILFALLAQEISVGTLAKKLSMTPSAISHQLRILKAGGLVRFRRAGKTLFYSLADAHVELILNHGMEHIRE
jgi:ArsR family transcriptional regulator